ncbi:uncharacterized protein BJ171DRAFT_568913 [Polychytrium aggregatum]|uniref:uncharacterized protein n=1 Tax=Polychytrium aggregatum TaxID=110093 RepID=UPI0022FE4121|nr:uncharacterized protein BJ171DRAFT_568913 [Polychytrium aggregatum]KAI9203489.1 hypothetical protein BJ171DRAFT_568913 [Polychytrium aggregatum]
MKVQIDEFEFDSDFDSGNLESVVDPLGGAGLEDSSAAPFPATKGTRRFVLFTRPDGAEEGATLSSSDKNRTWFHFSVRLASGPEVCSENRSDASAGPKKTLSSPAKGASARRMLPSRGSDSLTRLTKPVQLIFPNLNKVQKLFVAGMRPFFRRDGDGGWKRISRAPLFKAFDSGMRLCFEFDFYEAMSSTELQQLPRIDIKYYFAYGMPYSCADLHLRLNCLDALFKAHNPKAVPSLPSITQTVRKSIQDTHASIDRLGKTAGTTAEVGSLYWHRDTLAESIEKLPIEVLTITSTEDMLEIEEDCRIQGLFPDRAIPRAKRFLMANEQNQRPSLDGGDTGDSSGSHSTSPASDSNSSRTSRSSRRDIPVGNRKSRTKQGAKAAGKRFVFVSGRVHPGEAVASYMLDGFLGFIISADPRAKLLRSMFVFKIVPMLNPDGVRLGCYRGDGRAVNLNRVYDDPDPVLHPTIHATKQYIGYLSMLGSIAYYFDFHGHANKFGCFLFGNRLPLLDDRIQSWMFARCMELNCPQFDIQKCEFLRYEAPDSAGSARSLQERSDNMNRDRSGRAVMFREFGIVHSYTIEANYHCCQKPTRVTPRRMRDAGLSSPPVYPKAILGKGWSVDELEGMGKAVAISILDTARANPYTRVSWPTAQTWAREQAMAMSKEPSSGGSSSSSLVSISSIGSEAPSPRERPDGDSLRISVRLKSINLNDQYSKRPADPSRAVPALQR